MLTVYIFRDQAILAINLSSRGESRIQTLNLADCPQHSVTGKKQISVFYEQNLTNDTIITTTITLLYNARFVRQQPRRLDNRIWGGGRDCRGSKSRQNIRIFAPGSKRACA